MDSLNNIKTELRKFASERDWDQFHTPKNIALALTAEVGELVEHFQWLTEEQIINYLKSPKNKEAVADEIADVFSYLIRLSDKLDIALGPHFQKKLEKNKAKYPVEKAKGSAKKYSELDK